MKNTILFTIAFLALGLFTANGQKVYEDDVTMSLGTKNALFIEIEGAEKKRAEKIWKEYVEDFGKVDRNKKAKEYYSQQISVPTINGASPIDLYGKFEEMKDMTRFYLWVDLGGEFANSVDNEKQVDGAEEFLQGYYNKVRKYVVNEELKDEEDDLKDLEKDFSKLQDKNEDYHKDIEKKKKEILELEEKIEKNIEDQEAKTTEIEVQKEAVMKVTEKLNQIGNKYE